MNNSQKATSVSWSTPKDFILLSIHVEKEKVERVRKVGKLGKEGKTGK